jgi:hypothetical protein
MYSVADRLTYNRTICLAAGTPEVHAAAPVVVVTAVVVVAEEALKARNFRHVVVQYISLVSSYISCITVHLLTCIGTARAFHWRSRISPL